MSTLKTVRLNGTLVGFFASNSKGDGWLGYDAKRKCVTPKPLRKHFHVIRELRKLAESTLAKANPTAKKSRVKASKSERHAKRTPATCTHPDHSVTIANLKTGVRKCRQCHQEFPRIKSSDCNHPIAMQVPMSTKGKTFCQKCGLERKTDLVVQVGSPYLVPASKANPALTPA